jgi:leucyl aminopeptidase
MNNSDVYLCNLGRLVMADPLCFMKELAVKEVNPQLFTIATLTGHAARAYGDNYTVEKYS